MCRKVLSIFLSLAVAATMAGCGSAVLPVEEQEEPAPTATPVATDSAEMEIPVKEKTEEEFALHTLQITRCGMLQAF